MTPQKDAQRIIKLINQGHAAGDPVETIARRITSQMPHVSIEDIAHVARVHAEECYLDAGVQMAQAEAAKQIADILREVDQRCDGAKHTLGEACFLLTVWAQDGDARAVELLGELNKAALVVGLEE